MPPPTTCGTCNVYALAAVRLQAGPLHTRCSECAGPVATQYIIIEECEHGAQIIGLDSAPLCWRCDVRFEQEGKAVNAY